MRKFLLAMMLTPLMALADTEVVDGVTWTYTINDGKVQVGTGSSYSPAVSTSTTGVLTIPSTLGGSPVTSIGDYAFSGCSGLRSVTIPSSVTSVGNSAFSGCDNLEEVHIDSLDAFGLIKYGDYWSNPMNYADALYVAGELVEGTCTVTFYDENWGIYDPESGYSYVRSKTIEVGMGKGVLNPPEVMPMDMDKVFDGWDGDLLCVTSDMSVSAVFRQKTISEICSEWESPFVEEQYYFYDKNAHCLRFQGVLEMDEYLLDRLSWSKAWTTGYNQNTPYIEVVGYSKSWEEISRTWGWLMMIGEKNTIMFKMSDAETNGVSYVEIVLKSSNYDGEYSLLTLGMDDVEVRSPTSYHLGLYGTESLKGVKSGDVICYQMEEHSAFGGNSSRSISAWLDGIAGNDFYYYNGDSPIYSWGESGYSWFEWIVPFAEEGREREYREFCVMDTCYDKYDYAGKVMWNTTKYTYLAVINPDIMTYKVIFDLNGCSKRIGGGGLEQVVDDGMTAEAPQIEPLEGWYDVGWTPDPNCAITNDMQFVARGSAVDYAIRYVDTKGASNPNPLSYTITSEIVFSALPDTDEYWFRGWEPAKIEVGTTGDLIVTAKWERILPAIEGDEGATVTGDAETGFVVKASEGKTAVEVTIPQGVDAAKVTVEVSVKVTTVKPNGAKVKIVSGGADITEFLNVPAADGNGVVDLAKATVKEEIVKETMDPAKGAEIELNSMNPTLITPNTRKGLFYQLREGATLDGMKDGDSKVGDGLPWSPEITVKGGNSAFYSIGVGKGE